MKFLDARKDTTNPISPTLLRLKDMLMARHEKDKFFENAVISVCDFDPKIGHIGHLQMNFEPDLSESFKRGWFVTTRKHLHSLLLENTEWKRYVWGIYEESDEDFAKFVADALKKNPKMCDMLLDKYHLGNRRRAIELWATPGLVGKPLPGVRQLIRQFIVEHS